MSSVVEQELQFEESYYIGVMFSAILYGIYLGIYCLSLHAITKNANMTHLWRIFYISYSTTLLLLNTLFFPTLLLLGQNTWIKDRIKYPGDPLEYYFSQFSTANYMLSGNVAQNIAIFLADTLLIYRCYIVFGSRLYVVMIPALCATTTLALLMVTVPLGMNRSVVSSFKDRINAAGMMLTAITNVMVTAMISIRILSVYYGARKHAEYEIIRPYANIVAILVESAAPSAALGVLSSALMLRESIKWYMSVFLVWSSAVALSPQLIIFRIATGVAWTSTSSSICESSPTISLE